MGTGRCCIAIESVLPHTGTLVPPGFLQEYCFTNSQQIAVRPDREGTTTKNHEIGTSKLHVFTASRASLACH